VPALADDSDEREPHASPDGLLQNGTTSSSPTTPSSPSSSAPNKSSKRRRTESDQDEGDGDGDGNEDDDEKHQSIKHRRKRRRTRGGSRAVRNNEHQVTKEEAAQQSSEALRERPNHLMGSTSAAHVERPVLAAPLSLREPPTIITNVAEISIPQSSQAMFPGRSYTRTTLDAVESALMNALAAQDTVEQLERRKSEHILRLARAYGELQQPAIFKRTQELSNVTQFWFYVVRWPCTSVGS